MIRAKLCAWNIIFGDVRLITIIDLTQGCTPNHCYFTDGIIVSRNVQWYMENYYFRVYIYFYNRKIKYDEVMRFQSETCIIVSFLLTRFCVFLNQDRGEEKSYFDLWMMSDCNEWSSGLSRITRFLYLLTYERSLIDKEISSILRKI